MDNAASRKDIPGEDPPPTTPEDVTPQSSEILGQDIREFNMWNEETFDFGMINLQSENQHWNYEDPRGQPFGREELCSAFPSSSTLMDNAASPKDIPGEDPPAPAPTPQDARPQSSGILGEDEKYKLWSEGDEIFIPGRNFQSRDLYYKDSMGQTQGPFGRDEMIQRVFHGLHVVPDAAENTRISEDVTLTTGLKSSASESTKAKTSLECIPDTEISEDGTQTTGLKSSASGSTEVKTSLESNPDTEISEDVTQTTGLKSSASGSTEVKTSLESNPDRSDETANSVSTEAGERKEASKEMTPVSRSKSDAWGTSANPALPRATVREIIQEDKELWEASGKGKFDPSLRAKRSLSRP